MDKPIKLPPIPKHVQILFRDDMRTYARLAVEQNTAALRAECDALYKANVAATAAYEQWLTESKGRGQKAEAERDALRAELAAMTKRAEMAEGRDAEWAARAATWLGSPEAQSQMAGYRELGAKCAALETERDALRAELDRLTTLRPASEPRPAEVLLWDKHGEFGGNHVQQARMPDSWFWTPLPKVKEATP